jgi:hypothetical protein
VYFLICLNFVKKSLILSKFLDMMNLQTSRSISNYPKLKASSSNLISKQPVSLKFYYRLLGITGAYWSMNQLRREKLFMRIMAPHTSRISFPDSEKNCRPRLRGKLWTGSLVVFLLKEFKAQALQSKVSAGSGKVGGEAISKAQCPCVDIPPPAAVSGSHFGITFRADKVLSMMAQ